MNVELFPIHVILRFSIVVCVPPQKEHNLRIDCTEHFVFHNWKKKKKTNAHCFATLGQGQFFCARDYFKKIRKMISFHKFRIIWKLLWQTQADKVKKRLIREPVYFDNFVAMTLMFLVILEEKSRNWNAAALRCHVYKCNSLVTHTHTLQKVLKRPSCHSFLFIYSQYCKHFM